MGLHGTIILRTYTGIASDRASIRELRSVQQCIVVVIQYEAQIHSSPGSWSLGGFRRRLLGVVGSGSSHLSHAIIRIGRRRRLGLCGRAIGPSRGRQ